MPVVTRSQTKRALLNETIPSDTKHKVPSHTKHKVPSHPEHKACISTFYDTLHKCRTSRNKPATLDLNNTIEMIEAMYNIVQSYNQLKWTRIVYELKKSYIPEIHNELKRFMNMDCEIKRLCVLIDCIERFICKTL